MNTILLIPTGEGVGLTSACLGMIYALDCNGIKAGFKTVLSGRSRKFRPNYIFIWSFISKQTVQSIS